MATEEPVELFGLNENANIFTESNNVYQVLHNLREIIIKPSENYESISSMINKTTKIDHNSYVSKAILGDPDKIKDPYVKNKIKIQDYMKKKGLFNVEFNNYINNDGVYYLIDIIEDIKQKLPIKINLLESKKL